MSWLDRALGLSPSEAISVLWRACRFVLMAVRLDLAERSDLLLPVPSRAGMLPPRDNPPRRSLV